METIRRFSEAWLAGWLTALILSALLAGVVSAVLRLTAKTNASTRYAVWWLVLLVVVVLPFLLMPERNTAVPQPTPRPATVSPAVAAAPIEVAAGSRPNPMPDNAALAPFAGRQTSPASENESRWDLRLPVGSYPLWLFTLAGIVAAANLLRLAGAYAWVRRLRRGGQRSLTVLPESSRPVRLLTSADTAVPVAVGYLQPAVILPQDLEDELSVEELDHVLLHELAHLERRDDWMNLLERLVGALFWFDPVLRWVLAQIASEREVACDDWAVQRAGAAQSYAVTLTRVVELGLVRGRASLAMGMAGTASQISRRITRLLDASRNASLAISRPVALCAVGLLAGFLVLSARSPGLIVYSEIEPVMDSAEVQEAPPAPSQPAPAPDPAPPPNAARRNPVQPPQPVQPPAPRAMVWAAPSPRPVLAPHAALPHLDDEQADQSDEKKGPGFLAGLAAAGYKNLTVDQLINLRVHGVTPEYIGAMKAAGFASLTPDELVEMRIHGISPDYVASLNKEGLKNLTRKEVIDLRVHSVSAQSIRRAREYRPDLTVEQILKLKTAGVI